MENGPTFNSVVRKSAIVVELLACEYEALVHWRDTLLVPDLGFHALNRVSRIKIENNGLACKGLKVDLLKCFNHNFVF